MKRNLIAVAAALVLGSPVAFADNNYAFDDPYWKQSESAHSFQSVQPTESRDESRAKYDLVDNYIN